VVHQNVAGVSNERNVEKGEDTQQGVGLCNFGNEAHARNRRQVKPFVQTDGLFPHAGSGTKCTRAFKRLPLKQKMRPSLLHRYRCTRLDDLYTDHAPILKRMTALDSLRVLILGGPGTGKSTICTILIHEYYGDDGVDNVLHISSLNDQGIHFYRNDARTFCQTTCTRIGKKKMIVIDDMDALIESGQQIFLSYMDTFPKILFVVTASSPVKIMSGVHSRLLTVKLEAFPHEYMREELMRVAALEGLPIDPDLAGTVVARAGHSMRTLLNYLEKIILLGKGVTREVIDACCFTLDGRLLDAFSAAIEAHDEYAAIDVALEVNRDGYSVMDFLDAYFTFVKQAPLSDARKYAIVRILAKYIAIFNQHEHAIELLFCVHDLCA
jgi:DNA polymerase III delta prime subunit